MAKKMTALLLAILMLLSTCAAAETRTFTGKENPRRPPAAGARSPIIRVIGRAGASVISRVMGLILASVAVDGIVKAGREILGQAGAG